MIYLNVLLRVSISFAALWVLTRLSGKKQVSQLTLFDYITGISIGTIAGNLAMPGDPILPLVLAMALLSSFTIGMHRLVLRDQRLDAALSGSPTILVRAGQFVETNLRATSLTSRQVMGQLRAKGYFDLGEIEVAILEADGQLSVLPKSAFRPVQPRDLGLHPTAAGLPVQVIHEGRPLAAQLAEAGLSEETLRSQLAAQGITDPSQVFGAWLGSDDQLTISLYGNEGLPPH